MKKDFTKGMIKDVKFFVADEHKHLIMPFIDSINLKYNDLIEKNIEQPLAFHIGYFITYLDRILPFSSLDYFMCSHAKCVSMFEAIPELVPDGMRYNKELDKLVPDVIEDKKSVADEYFTGIDLKKEIINERENGFIKADLEKLDFSLVDPFAYSDLAFQLTVGAKKYSKDNWKKGDINIYLSALERHIQVIKIALDEDNIEKLIDDTGIQHGGALLCNSMFIHYFIRQILKDKNAK